MLRVAAVLACCVAWAAAQGPASQLVFTSAPAIAYTGATVGAVTVTVEDASGLTVSTSTAPIQLQITDPNGFSYAVGAVAASGVATLNAATAPLADGAYTLTASSPGLPRKRCK